MSFDQILVSVHGKKSIAHAVIPHRRKVEPDQIGQEEIISARVPGAISDVQCRRVVRAAARRSNRHGERGSCVFCDIDLSAGFGGCPSCGDVFRPSRYVHLSYPIDILGISANSPVNGYTVCCEVCR